MGIGLRRFSCGAEVYVASFVEGRRSLYLVAVWGLGVGLVVPRIGGLVASDQSLSKGELTGGVGECAGREGVSRALP